MDPGGNELEPELSQLDNPCLIVEDSQPDSAALEEDPDSSYRTLLARRLSSLQPTAHSPVLELISSPAGSRCSRTDSQSAAEQSNRELSPATMESSSAQEASQVLEVSSPSNQKRDLTPANGKQSEEGMEMESGGDSTTACVQAQEGGPHLGFLALSESQGVGGGLDGDHPAAAHADSDGQGTVQEGAEQNCAEGPAMDAQSGVSRRSEVIQSMTIQALLHAQVSDVQRAEEPKDDSLVPSSQDDMFEEEGHDAADSRMLTSGSLLLPTATPANSLHLLHLSGQGTLVQESLSQSSVDFVAPTQDCLSQTPLIVPNSPTAQDEVAEEPMDTSLPPDEPNRSRLREEEPMDMDQAPPGVDPTVSTPPSQNSSAVLLQKKSLRVLTQPEFSHDVFVPTPSQGEGSSGAKSAEKAEPGECHASQSQPNFQLELPSNADGSAVVHPEEEDSQATQIEEHRGADVTERGPGGGGACPADPQNHAGLQDDIPAADPVDTDGEEKRSPTSHCMQESPSDGNGPNDTADKVIIATVDLTTASGSQAQDATCSQNAVSSPQKVEVVDLTASCVLGLSSPVVTPGDGGTASQLELRSTVSGEPVQDGEAGDMMEVQLKSSEACESLGPEAAAPGGEDDDGAAEEGMDEGGPAEGPGLCLALSQSQLLSPEPMDEDEDSQHGEEGQPGVGYMGVRDDPERTQLRSEVTRDAPDGARHRDGVTREAPDGARHRDGVAVEAPDGARHRDGVAVEAPDGARHRDGVAVEAPDGARHRDGVAVEAPDGARHRDGVAVEDPDGARHRDGVAVEDPDRALPLQGTKSPQESTPPEMVAEKKLPSVLNDVGAQPGNPTTDGHSESQRESSGGAEEVSGSVVLSDTSGEIPFHFTLPKEGELIGPVAVATPPQISQLKQTPRHSTPIEMSSFSEQMPGDVTGEAAMTASEIVVEESGEVGNAGSANTDEAELTGKLSLRMKLVTPVEETSSGSERFSLQKPLLSDEEGSVSKVTTVVKAVTSSLPSSSVFTRVCEARRQVEAGEKAPPSEPSTPTRGDLFNSPLSPAGDLEREIPGLLTQRPKTSPRCGAIPEPGHSQQDGPGPSEADGGEVQEEGPPADGGGPSSPRTPEGGETSRTLPGHRAVSQQTSFDSSPSLPSRLRQRAVSQQTSFDTPEPHFPTTQVEPETSPPLRSIHGQAVRRHVRTIREVRTTVTRIITDVYYENGQEVDRKVTEELEEPLVECRVVENDVSPSRTGSSLTSGDLADVSSLSSKASSLQHSSSGTSSGGGGIPGPGRQADFAVPTGRGAKSLSPRKASGPQQAPHWGPTTSEWTEGRGRAPGTQPHTPLTPRGRGRRGRPPSRGPICRTAGKLSRDSGPAPTLTSSPEEEPYMRVRGHMADSPGDPDSPGVPSDSGSSSFVGLRVVAKWSSNSYFYSGCITRDCGAGRFRLLFDDRQECDVLGKDILLCDPIPLGTEVTALSEDEYFSTGVVKAHKTEGSEFLYCVEKDGQRKWYGRRAVILSLEQGNRLREQYGLGPYEPAMPLTKVYDISLDNLVEGKRRRRGNLVGSATPSRSSSDSPRTPGPSGKRKMATPAEEDRTPSKRGRRGARTEAPPLPSEWYVTHFLFTVVLGRTLAIWVSELAEGEGECGLWGRLPPVTVCALSRTGQRGNMFNTSGSGTELPSDASDLEETHGPLPQSASLFLGYAFLLTTSSELDREVNKPGSEAEEEYIQTAPYNRQYTEAQLEAGGGYILRDFDLQQCQAAYQSILIADQHCRTRKYLLCVASGVPCVSHIWVRDCCHDNQLLSYRNYLLPAGMGPDGHVVEWHSHQSPFKSMKVLLVSKEATSFLSDLLTMGGATSVHQHQVDGDTAELPEGTFDVLVTDRSCPPSVLNWAISVDLPLLSPEWLIQSLICGEKQDHRTQTRYKYDFSP